MEKAFNSGKIGHVEKPNVITDFEIGSGVHSLSQKINNTVKNFLNNNEGYIVDQIKLYDMTKDDIGNEFYTAIIVYKRKDD